MAKPIVDSGASASILLVDDSPTNLLALEAILGPLGQRLVRATSGEEALNCVSEEDFAVILMDLRMPGMGGLRAIELIRRREQSATVPIILLTALAADNSDLTAGYAHGAVDFLLKPFDPVILRSKVSVFIDLYLKEQTIKHQAAQLRERDREVFERRSERRFRALMDALPQCVWAARSDLLFYYWNKQASEYSGAPEGRPVPYSHLVDLIHPEDQTRVEVEWKAAIEAQQDVVFQARLRRHDGGAYQWFQIRTVPLREFQQVVGWIVSATDIDAQHHALEQAEIANRMKEEFLAIVSHELRNPLNAIKGWTHLLRSGSLDKAQCAKALETIERNVDLQTSLIEDLLDVSSIIRGKLKLSLKTIALAAVIEAALAAVRPTAEAKGVELEFVNDAPSDTSLGDADRLQQVFWNLLSNAIKFTPRGGRVTVRLGREAHRLVSMVRDTGQGIAPQFLPHVFERFRQAEGPLIRSHGGLGLGLAIVRHLVELHGGTVAADSEGIDQGSTFWVYLPEQIKESAGEAWNADRPSVGSRLLQDLSLLIVEDQLDSREALAETLRTFGANVKTAESALEALHVLEHTTPNLLISDIAMPLADGFDLIRKIRERISAQRMPAIAITGLSRRSEHEKALESGFQVCMVKPVSPQQLIESIKQLTHRM
ncbi:MAG TPA: response regulator [Candidatus Binataceae bacterium]|nr:response regulator [Candidatus Binataceae bacterium]